MHQGIGIPGIDPVDWLKSVWEWLTSLGRSNFGTDTYELAQHLSNDSLWSANADYWPVFALAYGSVVVLSSVMVMYGSAQIGLAGSDVDKVREGKNTFAQALRGLGAGILIPLALTLIMIFTEFFRKGALLVAPTPSEGTWFDTFKGILMPIADPGDFFLNLLVGKIATTTIGWEFDTLGKMVGTFSILALVAWLFAHKGWGRMLLRFSIGMVLGLATALPLQILVLSLAARVTDPTFTTTLIAVTIAAILPIITVAVWMAVNPAVKLLGGHTKVDEGKLETSPSDAPVPVSVLDGELDADIDASKPLPVDVMSLPQDEFDVTMQPQIGSSAEGTLLVAQRVDADNLDDGIQPDSSEHRRMLTSPSVEEGETDESQPPHTTEVSRRELTEQPNDGDPDLTYDNPSADEPRQQGTEPSD